MSSELCPDDVLYKIFTKLKFFELIEIASYNQDLKQIVFVKSVWKDILKYKWISRLCTYNNIEILLLTPKKNVLLDNFLRAGSPSIPSTMTIRS